MVTGQAVGLVREMYIGSGTEGCDSGNCLKLADVPSTATRTANLLKYMQPQLKFTARASSFEAGDTVDLNVKFGNPRKSMDWADGSETLTVPPTILTCMAYMAGRWATPRYRSRLTFDANLS